MLGSAEEDKSSSFINVEAVSVAAETTTWSSGVISKAILSLLVMPSSARSSVGYFEIPNLGNTE